MDSPEFERQRVARVKELEQMVKKLEQENKQLLTRVKTSASESTERQLQLQSKSSSSGTAHEVGGKRTEIARLDSLEDGIIDLGSLDDEQKPEDEW